MLSGNTKTNMSPSALIAKDRMISTASVVPRARTLVFRIAAQPRLGSGQRACRFVFKTSRPSLTCANRESACVYSDIARNGIVPAPAPGACHACILKYHSIVQRRRFRSWPFPLGAMRSSCRVAARAISCFMICLHMSTKTSEVCCPCRALVS